MALQSFVRIWGPMPPPIGGVASSVVAMAEWLRQQGHLVSIVNSARPLGSSVASIRRADIDIIHLSSPERLRLAAAIASVSRLPVVFVHGQSVLSGDKRGPSPGLVRLRSLGVEFWVNNALVRDWISESFGIESVLVSAHVPRFRTAHRSDHVSTTAGDAAVIAVYNGDVETYGLDLLLEAVDGDSELANIHPLQVVQYGSRPIPPVWMSRLARTNSTVHDNLGPRQVAELLGSSSVFLRPTRSDGDSLMVREALDLGTRVLGSDVVPRPLGVELLPLIAEHWAGALRGDLRGVIATGEGLGPSAVDMLSELIR